MHHMDESDIYKMFGGNESFSGMGGGSFLDQMLGYNPIIFPLNLTLEELYKGKTVKLKLTKTVLCGSCNGLGGKSGALHGCGKCRGKGEILVMRRMGPMVTKSYVPCDECAGKGEIFNEKDKCKKCRAQKTVQETSLIEAKIKPGIRDQQQIVFYGQGNEEPDVEPGDVVLVVKTKPHDIFKRKGDDLFIHKKISLNDALTGYSTVIQHLDGSLLLVSSIPGEVIRPDSVRGLIERGMPKPDSNERGNLYMIFDVEFPLSHFLSGSQYKKLEAILPPRPMVKIPVGMDACEVSLEEFDRHRYEGGGSGREAYHEDEDSDSEETAGYMPHGVQCAQQ
uniref:CR-type domain-containing protein n=1 Tax=Ditylenchus dipsaci TaxID=166011 RepID=A0A915E1D6_9BILA